MALQPVEPDRPTPVGQAFVEHPADPAPPARGQDADPGVHVLALDGDEPDAGGRPVRERDEVELVPGERVTVGVELRRRDRDGGDLVVHLDPGSDVVPAGERPDLGHRTPASFTSSRSVHDCRCGSKWPVTARAYGAPIRRA